jgi:hypothetical protein
MRKQQNIGTLKIEDRREGSYTIRIVDILALIMGRLSRTERKKI